MDSEDDFELAGDTGASDRAIARRETVRAFDHPLQHYADQFGKSLRTIKGWIAKGRKHDDRPPFDKPAEMAAWWERMREVGEIKWKVPEVFAFCDVSSKEGSPVEGVGLGDSVRAAQASASADALGFAAAFERLQLAERLAHARWQEELAKDKTEFDHVREKQRAEAWERAADKLTKMSEKAGKILGDDFAKWSDVEAAVVKRETGLRDALRSIGTRVATKLNLSTELFDRVVEVCDEELDSVFRASADGEPLFQLES